MELNRLLTFLCACIRRLRANTQTSSDQRVRPARGRAGDTVAVSLFITLLSVLLLFGAFAVVLLGASSVPSHAAQDPAQPAQASAPRRVLLPTPTPTPTPVARAVVTAPGPPVKTSVALGGLSHEWQTWNNCGPATLSMALSFHGNDLGQASVGATLRPNPEDKNVSPAELVAYARTQGLAGLVRANGDAAVLKRLLNAGFPVIVEVWLEPEPGDGFGHYRLLTGYDDAAQRWIAHDSYVAENFVAADGAYEGIYVSYETLDRQWRVFNRTFVTIYSGREQPQVVTALRAHADETFMWHRALTRAERELAADPGDVFAWFNRGTALVGMKEYESAVAAYDRAAAIGLPWRMLWYQFGPLKAYHETERYQDLVATAGRTLATTTDLEEVHYWRGVGLAALGDIDGARAAWSMSLRLRPTYLEADEALASVTRQ